MSNPMRYTVLGIRLIYNRSVHTYRQNDLSRTAPRQPGDHITMVSTAFEYALTFLIGITLITGGITAFAEVVDERDKSITEEHLEHVGMEVYNISLVQSSTNHHRSMGSGIQFKLGQTAKR